MTPAPPNHDLIELIATLAPVDEPYAHKPSPDTLIRMLNSELSDDRKERHCITEIPPTEHHHVTCEGCGILLACFDDCDKTTGICHDCATSCEVPAWSARDALKRHEAKRTAEARARLIADLTERLQGLTNEALVQVASFIEEVAGR